MPASSQKPSKKQAKKPVSDAPVVPGVKEIVIEGSDFVEPDTPQPTVTRNPDKNEIIIS